MLGGAPTTSRAFNALKTSGTTSRKPTCANTTSKQNPASQGQGGGTPKAEETGDSEDEVAPSPNMRIMLTRLQHVVSPGASSLVGGLDDSYKERATPKKPRPS